MVKVAELWKGNDIQQKLRGISIIFNWMVLGQILSLQQNILSDKNADNLESTEGQ